MSKLKWEMESSPGQPAWRSVLSGADSKFWLVAPVLPYPTWAVRFDLSDQASGQCVALEFFFFLAAPVSGHGLRIFLLPLRCSSWLLRWNLTDLRASSRQSSLAPFRLARPAGPAPSPARLSPLKNTFLPPSSFLHTFSSPTYHLSFRRIGKHLVHFIDISTSSTTSAIADDPFRAHLAAVIGLVVVVGWHRWIIVPLSSSRCRVWCTYLSWPDRASSRWM